MKIKCRREELIMALSSITRNSLSKTTMPILEGVLIETNEKDIKLTTNDLEIGSEYIINATIETSGSTVIDLKTFSEIIRKIEAEEIDLELKDNVFIIKSASGIFKLSTMNPEEYTKLPVFNVEKEVTIAQKLFKDMIRKTVFSTSVDQNRPVYTGSLISIENGIMVVVAIDGFRMAVRKEILEDKNLNFRAIIPAKTLNEIMKSLTDNDEDLVKIGVNKNQILFQIGPCTVISRIIEGDFLNYNSIIPSEVDTTLTINRKSLLVSLERVSIFSKEVSEKDKKVPVKMNINIDSLNISCVSVTGDAKETINTVVEGKELEIGFNPRYLLEALKVIEEDNIVLDFSSSISPLIIKPVSGNKYLYMVLPVKLKD